MDIHNNEFDNLDSNDLSIINQLKNNNNLNAYSTKAIDTIINLINPINSKNYITSLINIYNDIKYDELYIQTKYKIAKLLSEQFILNTNINLFPKNFFNYELVNYLIKKHLFYHNVFQILLSNWSYSEYFNFKPYTEHFVFYKTTCTTLYNKLEVFLQTSQYYAYRLSDFTIYTNFLKMMLTYTTSLSKPKQNEFFAQIIPLFSLVISNIYLIIISSRSTLYSMKNISLEKITKISANTIKTFIKQITLEIDKCNIELLYFFKNEKFMILFKEHYKSFSLDKLDENDNDKILSIVPILSQNWYSDISCIANINEIFRDKIILSIFTNKNINIHDRVKLLTSYNKKFFAQEICIPYLIDFYISIEKYDENSGFYEKDLTRNCILDILVEYIEPSPKEHSPNEYNILKNNFNFDRNKLKIFKKISKDTFNSFITLLISEGNEILSKITINYNKIYNNMLYQYNYNCKYINTIYKIYQYLLFLGYILEIDDDKKTNIFIAKINEFTHTIIPVFYNIRLYSEISELRHIKSKTFVTEKFSSVIDSIICLLFNIIDRHISDERYINCLMKNSDIYNKKSLINTKDLVGFYRISNLNSDIFSIIESYTSKIDTLTFNYNSKKDKFKNEIPADFLDPIYYTPIASPLELPETKNIVDKDIILNHLVFHKKNPFNGLYLDEKILIAYNDSQEVKNRINIFMNKFNKWKIDNKI